MTRSCSNLLLPLLLTLACLGACDAESDVDETPLELFDVEYRFALENDSRVLAVEIIHTTYFPDEDVTRFGFKTYQANELVGSAGVVVVPNCYIGCVREAVYKIYGQWDGGEPQWWWYYARRLSIDSPEGRVIELTWPADEALCSPRDDPDGEIAFQCDI